MEHNTDTYELLIIFLWIVDQQILFSVASALITVASGSLFDFFVAVDR